MPRRKSQTQTPQQPYDSALKGLMENHAGEIISQLLPHTRVIREENSEIKREALRVDLAYLVERLLSAYILNLELQSGTDQEMAERMLRYHVELYPRHHLPVISVILYLFESTLPTPPFRVIDGDKILLSMDYQVIALWKLDAQKYLQSGIICMYTFLPAMKGATAPMLIQALRAMEQEYSRYHFSRHLTRFIYILQRSTTVSEEDKEIVMKVIHTEYDSLIDENLEVQKRVEKGAVQALQVAIMDRIQNDFPTLTELAQECLQYIDKPEEMRKLLRHIYLAEDEQKARQILNDFIH